MPDEIRTDEAAQASPSTDMAGHAAASAAVPVVADAARAAVPAALAGLRDATADLHERLHVLMPLSVESADLRDYLDHLRVLRAWLAPLEPWLAACGDAAAAHPQALPPVSRVALIDADMAAAPADLARPVTHPDFPPAAPASLAPWWPATAGSAYRWGVSYVIEGSQMGGAVLYQRLHERLAPHPLGFLAAGRHDLSVRWKAFVRGLAAEVATPAAIAEACRGALEAFERLVELALAHRERAESVSANAVAAPAVAG